MELERTIDTLIGDTPVSEQISVALTYTAAKDHKHENYATKEELDALKVVVEKLVGLIGDTSVSEQISSAIHNIK